MARLTRTHASRGDVASPFHPGNVISAARGVNREPTERGRSGGRAVGVFRPHLGASPQRMLLSLMVGALVLAPLGCRKRELPEHERQLKERQAREALLREKRKRGEGPTISPNQQGLAHHAHDKDHSDDPQPVPLEDVDDRKWPVGVKKALYRLLTVSMVGAPSAIRQLAMQGPAAFEAMRFFLGLKQQPKAKRAALALMLAELQMFRPAALAQQAREPARPFLQRAAIELLARQKHPHAQALLAEVRTSEKPMRAFIDHANSSKGMSFNAEQLAQLDGVLNGEPLAKVKERLLAIHSFDLESGLLAIIVVRGARPVVQGLVAQRLAALAAAGDRARLRRYGQVVALPPILRLAAARMLLASQDPEDKALLNSIRSDPKDPLARMLPRLAPLADVGH